MYFCADRVCCGKLESLTVKYNQPELNTGPLWTYDGVVSLAAPKHDRNLLWLRGPSEKVPHGLALGKRAVGVATLRTSFTRALTNMLDSLLIKKVKKSRAAVNARLRGR